MKQKNKILCVILFAISVSCSEGCISCRNDALMPNLLDNLTEESFHKIQWDLDRSELIALLGNPDYIKSSKEEFLIDGESLYYIRTNIKFVFAFEGDRLAAYSCQNLSKFSKQEFTDKSYTTSNPFLDFKLSDVKSILFLDGMKIKGPFFVTRDRNEIKSLYDSVTKLKIDNDEGPGCFCQYRLAKVEFYDVEGKLLANFSVTVNEHDNQHWIYVSEPNNYADKYFIAESKDLSHNCFLLMIKHCPDVLKEILMLEEPDRKDFLMKNYPFMNLDKNIQQER